MADAKPTTTRRTIGPWRWRRNPARDQELLAWMREQEAINRDLNERLARLEDRDRRVFETPVASLPVQYETTYRCNLCGQMRSVNHTCSVVRHG